MKKKQPNQNLQMSTTRITRTLFFFIGFFALSIIIFDSGNLITREAVVDRWSLVSVLLLVNTAVWYFGARDNRSPKIPHSLLITAAATTLLVFAGYMTYWERGMASTSTVLYALPILIIANLKNRHAIIAYTTLAAGTYSLAAVKYFNDFFNEGYRVQLWGNLVLYGGTIFVIGWLIMVATGLRRDSK